MNYTKVLYTTFSILINNECILILPEEILNEMEHCMNRIPMDLTNREENNNFSKNLKFWFWTFFYFI